MKKGLIKVMVLVSAIVILTNCKKLGKTYDAFFYTNIDSRSGPLTLELDGKIIGELPLLKATLSTTNDTILHKAIHLRLRTGNYKILVRNNQGDVKCSGNLIFRFNRFNGATNPGALEHAMSDKIIVTRVFFE
jgi:hypothetical protein